MSSFAEFSRHKQASAIRRALEGIVDASSVRLVLHGFNSTYRVQVGEHDLAVRLNINSRRTLPMVQGEVDFIQQAQKQGVRVPHPVPIFEGSPITTTRVEGLDHEVPVVAYAWMPGRSPSDACAPATLFKVGALMASLQQATKGWQTANTRQRPTYQEVLDGQPWRMTTPAATEVRERADAVIKSLGQPQLVHFDLHLSNVKLHQGALTVFDFDDSVWSHPAVDAAQSLFYFRRGKQAQQAETAFWQGFGMAVEDLGIDRETLELLIAARAVLLANEVLGSVSQELTQMAPAYAEVTERRLQHYLDTGIYDPKVAKMN